MTEFIKNSALLARIALSNEDIERFSDLTEIIAMIHQIASVDTTGVAPLAHPLDISLRLREDQVTEYNQRDKLLASAPSSAAGVYLVPEVFEE